ncbi:MAG: MFS transporter [Halofilum sp. (in: g-proteobacteria)]|nr:MFS transporter [Halofilum sp. (in: g-proteobacteria)]
MEDRDTTTTRLPPGLVLRLFLPFAAGYYLSYLFRTVNAVAAPNLVADTGLGADALGFLTATYMAAFALLQLPLGLALDRFGPRRVEAALLTVAAAGSLVFALADDLAGLSLGRALIGAGVSCCMMASFKAFAMWFAPRRLPLVYACLLTSGALGAISATVPVEWFLTLLDWRVLFAGLAVCALIVSAAVFTIVPDHAEPPAHLTFADQLRGLGQVFRDRFFLGIAPMAALSSGSSLAINGLWSGPWLRDVAGLARAGVATHLLILTTGMGVGFLAWGVLTERLMRLGLRPMSVAGGGLVTFLLLLVYLAAGGSGGATLGLSLAAFGFFATAPSLTYSLLAQHFPRDLAGRANTALNVLVFVAAFVLQWGIGVVLSAWEDPVARTYDPTGYQVAFGGVVALQLVALAWFARQWWRHADERRPHPVAPRAPAFDPDAEP